VSARDYVHAVRMENIHMAFGNVVALRNINLEVGANEIVGLIGDNGAGKSTLIKIVTGVLRPSGGRLYLRDQLIDRAVLGAARHDLRIEVVHQRIARRQAPLWRTVGRQIITASASSTSGVRALANELLSTDRLSRRGSTPIHRRRPVRRRAPGHRDWPRHVLRRRPDHPR
jgi:simple sugar transport system ATP-binding protein